MPSLLQQLENNEAVLLMYLADELAVDDLAEVEQMLAADPGMRAELERVCAAHAVVLDGLQDLDRHIPPAVSEAVAVRQVSRVMRQWHAERFNQDRSTETKRRMQFPWWIYPAASAAAVVLVVLAWWGLKNDAPDNNVAQQVVEEDDATRVAFSLLSQEDNGPGMAEAEQQASNLSQRHEELSQQDQFLIDPAQLN